MVSHRKPAKPAFDPRTVKENIVETPLNEEMSKSFLEYAYSVIYARALPDARDGLKPVQRRIIYQMGQMSLNPDRPYMKSRVCWRSDGQAPSAWRFRDLRGDGTFGAAVRDAAAIGGRSRQFRFSR